MGTPSQTGDLVPLPHPGYGTRVSAFGDTGSGKTYLLRNIFRAYEHGIAIDTKHDGELTGFGKVIRGNDIFDVAGGRYIWRPPDSFPFDEAERERFYAWALAGGRRAIYTDEYGDVCESTQSYPRGLRLCFMRGRSRKLTMIGTSQEPTRVPTFIFGQAHHLYVFFCGYPSHRQMAEQMFGAPIEWDAIPYGSHRFLYKGPHGRSGPHRLKVPKVA